MKKNADSVLFDPRVKLWLFIHLFILLPSIKMSEPDSSSVFSGNVENGTFLELFPTSLSTSVDPSSGHLSNVYIYVSIFLSLLAFLLLLLIIALQRLKNIISSSSSYPEYPSDAGSSFTNLEVCSISSQRSTFSNLSSWRKWKSPCRLQSLGFPSQEMSHEAFASWKKWAFCFCQLIRPVSPSPSPLIFLLLLLMMLFICEYRSWCWQKCLQTSSCRISHKPLESGAGFFKLGRFIPLCWTPEAEVTWGDLAVDGGYGLCTSFLLQNRETDSASRTWQN